MIKLIKPYISFEEVQNEFKEVFDSGWFTKGRFVEEFIEEIKNYHNDFLKVFNKLIIV